MDRPHISDMIGVRWSLAKPFTARVLSARDLNAIGTGDLGVEELRWDADNDWTVPVNMLDAQAVDALIGTGEFVAV